jgi:O-antigen ligase
MTRDERWTAIFDRIALFLTLLGFLLREWTPGTTAGTGLNLFIHLLFWVALTLWFAGRATAAGAVYAFTGFEFAFLAFAIVALISVQRASFRLAALDQAMTWLSYTLFFVLCVQLIGRRLLLSILLATVFTISLYALIQKAVLFPMIQPAAEGATVEMARRIRTNEPFATFIGPNQLAGYLVLLLPILFGSMMDTRDFKIRLVGLVIGGVALALTESKGGLVAMGCGIVAMLALHKTQSTGRGVVVGIGVAATAVALALLLWTPLMSAVARHSHSAHVRAVYWRATRPIIAESPMLGVGLDNWQDHYFQTKSPVQQETKKAHNDYLQILSETGIVGFLALAGILILGLRKALAREADPEPEKDDPGLPWVGATVGLLVLLGALQSTDAVGTCLAIVLGAAWLGAWHLLRRSPAPATLTWTRIGLAGGLLAFMVHMFVDFQLYEYGVTAGFVAVLALIALARGKAVRVQIPKAVCGIATAVLMAVAAPMLIWLTPRAMASDNELEEARAALADLESGLSANPTKLISDAIRITESAQAHDPVNPETYQLFARAKFHEWDLLQRAGAREGRTLEESEEVVLQALDNAIKLRPLLSPLHYELSKAHRIFRRYYLKAGKNSEMAAAKAAEHLRLAIESQRRAYELYPTFSRNAYLLGRLLEIAKDPDAPRYYKEAMALSDRAGEELEDLDRLKLSPVARARCLRALGKPFEAHDLLDAYLRKAIQGLPAADARDRLERIVRSYEDELEEGMTPVLKDVVDAIMRDLKK